MWFNVAFKNFCIQPTSTGKNNISRQFWARETWNLCFVALTVIIAKELFEKNKKEKKNGMESGGGP